MHATNELHVLSSATSDTRTAEAVTGVEQQPLMDRPHQGGGSRCSVASSDLRRQYELKWHDVELIREGNPSGDERNHRSRRRRK